MKAIILAAGQGKRLAEYTQGLPKCLLPLGSETVLSREIRILQEAGIMREDIFVVGGYKHESLESISPNLIINDHYKDKDNAYSLALGLKSVGKEDILILDADLCFERALLSEIIDHPQKNVLMCKKADDLEESTGIIADNKGRVQAIGKQYLGTGLVYISIFKVGHETVTDFIDTLLEARSSKTWYTLAITELCDKHHFYVATTDEKWHEIDFVEDYLETQKMFSLE